MAVRFLFLPNDSKEEEEEEGVDNLDDTTNKKEKIEGFWGDERISGGRTRGALRLVHTRSGVIAMRREGTDEEGTKALIEGEKHSSALLDENIGTEEKTLIHVMEKLVVDEDSNLSQRGKQSLNRTNL